MKFEMVLKMSLECIEINVCCETLEVSRSGYYAWKDRPEAERTKENRRLTELMRSIHKESRGTASGVSPILTRPGCGEGVCSRRSSMALPSTP